MLLTQRPRVLSRLRAGYSKFIKAHFKSQNGYSTGQSKIHELYKRGDKRKYYVCCLKCGEAQSLRWERVNPDTGEKTGMVWEMTDDRLDRKTSPSSAGPSP